MNMYILAYNSNKNLVTANTALKENLKTYLNKYRMLTDAINIKNAYIVNIGIAFEVMILPNYSANDVVAKCIKYLKEYFAIDKWQINQPIYKANIINGLLTIKGVQTVTKLDIINLFNSAQGYIPNIYDIKSATINNIVYPSVDPMVFEVRYLNNDIWGKAITY